MENMVEYIDDLVTNVFLKKDPLAGQLLII